jgi:hypothetical protein
VPAGSDQLAGSVGYATVFTVIGGTLAVLALASQGALTGIQRLEFEKETT